MSHSLLSCQQMKRRKTILKRKAEQHETIARLYESGKYTTEQLAKIYGIGTRQIQRIASMQGVIRTVSESNKLMAPLKNYKKLPTELRAKRKDLLQRVRYSLISKHPYCSLCGLTVEDGMKLEVDHIDNDATNNDLSNLQVLCHKCNVGKSGLRRWGLPT